MRMHNSLILVTEPVAITTMALTGTETPLPDVPIGDLGREVKQITIRSLAGAWEWGFLSVSSTYFWMDEFEILVFPVRDQVQLNDFRLRAADGAADLRLIYEA